ncbi:MAG: RluA family pseudouridine synthase [Campylobacterota bacterium]|nr:RluA family pseudouridine synthase [Campylobacterota bacterium]
MNNKEFIAQEETRLDIFLSQQLEENRNQIEQLIKKGFVTVENKKKAKSGLKLHKGQKVFVTLPEVEKKEPLKVDFHVDIVYEDEYFMVLNKPAGVIVHDAPSVNEATLVDWLKTKKISLSTISGEERHGIVHRLDKGTSGLIVIAKTNEAHVALSRQLEDRTMGRYYLAFIDLPLKEDIEVNKPIARNPNNRLKMGIVPHGKSAKTRFIKLQTSLDEDISRNNMTRINYELIAAKLYTGRTHQIRVHLESLNRHIVGDSLYGFKGNTDKINRVYLHAFSLYLKHPISNKDMNFNIDLPNDMKKFYMENFNKDSYSEKVNSEYIIDRLESSI